MNEDTLWLQAPAATQCFDIQIESRHNRILAGAEQINMTLFAADHGVTREEMPASLQSNTMINKIFYDVSFTHILSDIFNIKVEVINLGSVVNMDSLDGVINQQLSTSTENFCHKSAMNREQFSTAINIGRQSAQRAKLCNTEFFICSDINKENTIAATAILCALLNISPEQLINANDGHTIALINKALNHHIENLNSPLEILRRLGGYEIAAMTGSYLCCAHMGLPVIVDGLTSATAALIAARLCPDAEKWFLFSATPEIQAHKIIVEILHMQSVWNYISYEKINMESTHYLKVAN